MRSSPTSGPSPRGGGRNFRTPGGQSGSARATLPAGYLPITGQLTASAANLTWGGLWGSPNGAVLKAPRARSYNAVTCRAVFALPNDYAALATGHVSASFTG